MFTNGEMQIGRVGYCAALPMWTQAPSINFRLKRKPATLDQCTRKPSWLPLQFSMSLLAMLLAPICNRKKPGPLGGRNPGFLNR
jgi:hypothetical protein